MEEKQEALNFSHEISEERIETLPPESIKKEEETVSDISAIEKITELEKDVKLFENAISLAERKMKLREKMIEISLKATSHLDWVDQDGSPYLMCSGCEGLADIWGISLIEKEKPQKIWTEDEKGRYYIYIQKGTFKKGDRSIIVEGKCSQRDSFFGTWTEWIKNTEGKTEKIIHIKPLSEIREEDIIQAAYSNLFANGVKRLLGIRNISYEMLENAGIKIDLIKRIERKKKEEDPKIKQKKDEIMLYLKHNSAGNETWIKQEIKRLTTWKDKEGKIHAGVESLDNISEKMTNIIHARLFPQTKEEKK